LTRVPRGGRREEGLPLSRPRGKGKKKYQASKSPVNQRKEDEWEREKPVVRHRGEKQTRLSSGKRTLSGSNYKGKLKQHGGGEIWRIIPERGVTPEKTATPWLRKRFSRPM